MPTKAASRANIGYYRFSLGKLTALSLHDGTASRDRASGFVRNITEDDISAAFAEIGLPPDKLTLTFTSLALDSPKGLILFDPGWGMRGPPSTGSLIPNLLAAGYEAQDVSTVIISHFHSDHISGLLAADDTPAFPNAQIQVPRREWQYWMGDDPTAPRLGVDQVTGVFGALSERVSQFDWGDELLPGITALQADGHTPDQTAFEIASGGERLIYAADVTNNPLIFARRPDWQPIFDVDGDRARESRHLMLARAARERLLMFFFHAPFPALGHVAAVDGNEYLPALWCQ
nr:MBL fold metallo-hydrolase [Rhizobium gallicum]